VAGENPPNPWTAGGRSTKIEESRRQDEVGNVSVPLGDGGEKKFNWASELST
jgi:hypothetical protein